MLWYKYYLHEANVNVFYLQQFFVIPKQTSSSLLPSLSFCNRLEFLILLNFVSLGRAMSSIQMEISLSPSYFHVSLLIHPNDGIHHDSVLIICPLFSIVQWYFLALPIQDRWWYQVINVTVTACQAPKLKWWFNKAPYRKCQIPVATFPQNRLMIILIHVQCIRLFQSPKLLHFCVWRVFFSQWT